MKYKLVDKYKNLLIEKKISETDINDYIEKYNNIVREMSIKWEVNKD